MLRPPAATIRGRGMALAGMVAALALTAASLVAAPAKAATVGPDGEPITNDKGVTFVIVAHRGGADVRPENSVEAYRYSVAQAFDVIETDLLFTRDGHGVMTHNDVLPSRCTYSGRRVHELTLTQVRSVRCADLSGRKTVPIPTFAEFAAVVKPSDIRIELDVKTYSGQPASGERRYAERAVNLLKQHGLLERASILTYRWDTTLSTIRRLAPGIRVVGLDNKPMDLARVRLAASLGADGYGIKAKDSPTNLLKYIKAKGMDPVPWEVRGTQLQAYAIHFSGPVYGVSSDDPAAAREDLLSGRININPTATTVVRNLAKRVTVAARTTYQANEPRYPRVMGVAVPWSRLAMLESVSVKVTVYNGPGSGQLNLGASGSPYSSGIKVALPRGTKSLWVKVPVGNGGKIRVFTTRRASVKLEVVAYRNLAFS